MSSQRKEHLILRIAAVAGVHLIGVWTFFVFTDFTLFGLVIVGLLQPIYALPAALWLRRRGLVETSNAFVISSATLLGGAMVLGCVGLHERWV